MRSIEVTLGLNISNEELIFSFVLVYFFLALVKLYLSQIFIGFGQSNYFFRILLGIDRATTRLGLIVIGTKAST